MNDFVTSLIRTYVPIGVGALAAWLTARGIEVDAVTAQGLVPFLTAVFSGGYYLAVRLAEKKWPQVGWLLGQAKAVKYTDPK